MKINISPEHFEEILKKGYSLDIVFMLKALEEGMDMDVLCERSDKILALKDTIVRKGLITEEGKLTLSGMELVEYIIKPSTAKIVKRKPDNDAFMQWWNQFPATDTFSYKGRKFIGSRSLRQAKDVCRTLFDKILLEGDYKAEQLTAALRIEIEQKMENSIRTGNNKLSFMQNSATYLRQRTFESFVSLIGTKTTETEENIYNGTEA
jgi:hypothetical protein